MNEQDEISTKIVDRKLSNEYTTLILSKEELGILVEYCRSDIKFVNQIIKSDKIPKEKLSEIKEVKMKVVNLGAKLRRKLEELDDT